MKKRICAAALSLSLCASMAAGTAALSVDQARELLGEHYISPLSQAAQQAETLEELLGALNDPYTVYYTPEEYADFLHSVNGDEVTGIGVSIRTVFDGGFTILSVIAGSPAMEAGLMDGDTVIAVDGVTLTDKDDIAALLSGAAGTVVTVTVLRPDGTVADFTMERRTVLVPIVSFEMRESAGWFDCDSFGLSTPDEVGLALADPDCDPGVWVMDLRGNPGGMSDAAALTATHFTGGNLMVYFCDAQGIYYGTRSSPKEPDLTDKPLIILTDAVSASASELFSGTIRDYGAGIAIGTRTFGKGSAQILLDKSGYPEIFEDDCLKLTAYQFFSPNGLTCNLIGVLPTLMMDRAHAADAALLLSSPVPADAHGWLKLELAGQSFYLSPEACRKAPEVTSALLEALPPAARLYRGFASESWLEKSPAGIAQWLGVEYSPRTFSDVESSPYREAIDTLACYGLIAGDGAGNFLPEQTLTRGELAAMLAAAFQLPEAQAIPFSDVSPDAWYADAVGALAARGFLAGTDEGAFLPDREVTNQELHTVLSAIAQWISMDARTQAEKPYSAVQWLDYYRYPEWAQEHTRNLYELGVSVDRENPDTTVTRGACAQVLYELMDVLGMFWY